MHGKFKQSCGWFQFTFVIGRCDRAAASKGILPAIHTGFSSSSEWTKVGVWLWWMLLMQRHSTGTEEGWKGTGHHCEARWAVTGVHSTQGHTGRSSRFKPNAGPVYLESMVMTVTVPTVSAALYLMLFWIRKVLVALHRWNNILLEDGSSL